MSSILPDTIFESLPSNNCEAALEIIRLISEHDSDDLFVEDLVEAFIFLAKFCDEHGIRASTPDLNTSDERTIRHKIWLCINAIENDIKRKQIFEAKNRGLERYAKLSGQLFCYKFSETDITKIQGYLNELWALISTSSELEEDHRKRLLERLEQLQDELNKNLSDLDRFWGLIGDAGTIIAKMRNCAEKGAKIMNLIALIGNIVFVTQNEAHGLPNSGSHPLLMNSKIELVHPAEPNTTKA